MSELTKRYAQGLFSLISKEEYQEYKTQAKLLQTLFHDNPDFISLLDSAFIKRKDKEEIIKSTLKGFNEYLVSFTLVICSNHRIKEIHNILQDFISLINEEVGIKEGLVYSTYELSKDELTRIENSISKVEKRHVELINLIDVSLLGGVKVLIGDKVYDGTIKNKLNNMKNDLLSGR